MNLACPKCGQPDVHHSRFRGWTERLRFNLTGRLPFRCHQCDWRGWRKDVSRSGESLREVHKQLTEDQLDDLDPDVKPAERSSRR